MRNNAVEDIMRYVLAIGFVLGSLLWIARRYGRPWNKPRAAEAGQSTNWYRLERISSLRLGPQQTVHLVGVANQVWLVACSPAGASLLSQVPPATAGSNHLDGAR